MRPAPRSDDELLAWAAAIVQREQKNRTFGTVTIHLNEGTIIRVNTDKNEVPPPGPAAVLPPHIAAKTVKSRT